MKSFVDHAYSICFLSRFEFRLVHLKIKFSSTCELGSRYKTCKKRTVVIVILFFLVYLCDDFSFSVQLRDQTQITHEAFITRLNDGAFQ